jgi:hypothetical protein
MFHSLQAKFPDGISPELGVRRDAGEGAPLVATSRQDDAQRKLEALRAGRNVRAGLLSSEIEEEHVYKVYDEIAHHWHHTRGKRKVCAS